MGYEIQEIEKHNKVYSLSFVQAQYDKSLAEEEHKDGFFYLTLDRNSKIRNIIRHPNLPWFFGTRASENFYDKLCEIVEKNHIDAIHAEFSAMGYYEKIKSKYPHIKFTYVLHDVAAQSYKRKYDSEKNPLKKLVLKAQLNSIIKYEGRWVNDADAVLTFSEKDRELANSLYRTDKVQRINDFIPGLDDSTEKYHRKNDGYQSIMFFGQMGRQENEEAAMLLIESFKRVAAERTEENARIYIIGSNPTDQVKAEACENIIVTGFVDNTSEYIIENCDIAIFPLTMGAGIKVKVLTTMALGLPVVTTDIGAEGIDEEGKYLQLVNSKDELDHAIRDVLDGKMQLDGKCGQEYILREFSWEKTCEVLTSLY